MEENENQTGTIGSLFETAGDYVETRIDLFKLKIADKSTEIIASLTGVIIIALITMVGFVILNIGLCLWLGDLTGKVYYGFFIVGGFYLLVAVLVFWLKEKWIKEPISDMIIKKLFN
jgi:hypothetical protein